MQLKCVRAFGNFKPGDLVEAPDGAVFDHFYFEQVQAVPSPAASAAPVQAATPVANPASPVAPKPIPGGAQ